MFVTYGEAPIFCLVFMPFEAADPPHVHNIIDGLWSIPQAMVKVSKETPKVGGRRRSVFGCLALVVFRRFCNSAYRVSRAHSRSFV